MAKKAEKPGSKAGKVTKTTTVETHESGEEAGDELDLGGEESGGEALDGLERLQLLGAETDDKYEIRRTSPRELKGYVCTWAADEFTLERLQEEWGPGVYNIRVRHADGTFAQGSVNFEVAALPKHKQAAPGVVAASPGPSVAAEISAAFAPILNAMQESARNNNDMIMKLLLAQMQKPEPKAPEPPNYIEMLAALKELMPQPPKNESAADAVKLLLQGLELGKEIGGNSGDTNFMDLAAKGLDMVGGMAARSPAAPAPARIAHAQPKLLAPATVAAAPAAQESPPVVQPGSPPMMQMLNWLNQQVRMLVHQAAANKRPELYAALFMDNLPPFLTDDEVFRRFSDPTAIAQLGQLNADVLKFPQWFEAFRLAVLAEFEDEEGDEPGLTDEQERDAHDEMGGPTGPIDDPPNAGGADDPLGQD